MLAAKVWLSEDNEMKPIPITIAIASVLALLSCNTSSKVKLIDNSAFVDAASTNDIATVNAFYAQGGDRTIVNTFEYHGAHIMNVVQSAEMARLLVDHGADPNIKDSGGSTPLMSAALTGNVDVARFLLDKKVDPNATNDGGATALAMASEQGNAEVVSLLLHSGANPNIGGLLNTPLTHAINGKHVEVVKALLVGGATVDHSQAEMARTVGDKAILGLIAALDPYAQVMKRFAADQAKYNRLRSELAAFLQEAQRTGHLDEQKLAEYQGQMKHLQAELQSLLGR